MNKQLGLFGDEVGIVHKKNRIRRHDGRKIDAITKHILREIKNESESVQESIVCTLYYYTICENLDKMPQIEVEYIILRLIERYLNATDI